MVRKAIIKLVMRVIGFRAIQFNGSQIFLWGVPMILLPMTSLSDLQQRLIDKYGYKDVSSIFYHLGKLQGKNGTNILLQRYQFKADINDLRFFLEQTQLIGIGIIGIKKHEPEEGYILIENIRPLQAMSYKEMFGSQERPIDIYLRGLIVGSYSEILNGNRTKKIDLTCIEIECYAGNGRNCQFEIRQSLEWKKEKSRRELFPRDIKEINELIKRESALTLLQPAQSALSDPETMLSRSLKDKFKGNIIKFDDGKVILLGVTGLITPMDIMVLLAEVLQRRFGKSSNDVFYASGRELGVETAHRLLKFFEINNSREGVELLMGSIGLYGFGKPELVSYNINKRVLAVKVIENYFSMQYIRLVGRQKEVKDFFLAGIISGLIKGAFNKEIEIVEKVCHSQGSPYCLFQSA